MIEIHCVIPTLLIAAYSPLSHKDSVVATPRTCEPSSRRIEVLEARIAPAFAPVLELSALTGPNGFQINGEGEDNFAGLVVSSAGDINGDNIDDLLIVAREFPPILAIPPASGVEAIPSDKGVAYVVFGKTGGFGANFQLSNLNGTDGFQIDGQAGIEGGGAKAQAAGDINGDGFDDIVLGMPYANVAGAYSGVSYVVFGRGSGFSSTLSLGALNGTNGFRINPQFAGDYAGASVSGVGDINGDGIADLAIGALGFDANSNANAGAVYVIFGKTTAFASTLALSSVSGAVGFRIHGEAADDRFHVVRTAGDINGDNVADIIIGANGVDANGNQSGAAYIVFGRTTGLPNVIQASNLNGTNGFQISGESAYSSVGSAVGSAGDLNGDGFDDMVIGSLSENFSSGASYVVFGKSTAFVSNLQLSSLNGTTGFQINGEANYDYSGRSISSAGDFNGDGFDDLLVGATGSDANGSNSGATYLIFGKATGFASAFGLTSLSGTNGFRIDGELLGDSSGRAVAPAGDVNGDGFDDFIIGAPNADPNGNNSGAAYVVFGRTDAVFTIADASITEGDSGTSDMVFTVTLSAPSVNPISVTYATGSGTALAGQDFVAVPPTVLTFAPGQTSRTLTVPIIGDLTVESFQTFSVNLSNPTNGSIADGTAVGSIADNDVPGIQIFDAALLEGNSGTSNLVFTVTLTQTPVLPATVQFMTMSGSATSPSDFVAIGLTTLNFGVGETSKTITVQVVGDTAVELTESFSVVLSNPTNATLVNATATGTIQNNDLPGLSIGDVSLSEGNSGSALATFTVSLSAAVSDSVTVSYSTASGTAVAGQDFTAVSPTMLTFNPGQTTRTLTVPILGDLVVEGDETFSLVLSNAVNAAIQDGTAVATITNDDQPTLSVTDASITEGNTGTAALNFTVTLSQTHVVPVSVSYSTADGTATAPSDYVALGLTTLTFAPGKTSKTVTVQIVGDSVLESQESFMLGLSNPVNASIADGSAVGTIIDNDNVQFSVADITANEGGLYTITINASMPTPAAGSIRVTTIDGTATFADYFGLLNSEIPFGVGQTIITFQAQTLDDALLEGNETFTITIFDPSIGGVADSEGVVTIIDNDLAVEKGKAVTITDLDGDVITISLPGGPKLLPSDFIFNLDGTIASIDLRRFGFAGGTPFPKVLNLTLIAKTPRGGGGDGIVSIGAIDATGVNLGTLTIGGDVGIILAGDGNSLIPAIKSLNVRGSLGPAIPGEDPASTVLVGDVRSFTVGGNIQNASVEVFGALGSLKIGGDLIGRTGATLAQIAAFAETGELPRVGGGLPFGAVSATSIKTFTVSGSVQGGSVTATAGDVGSVSVRGNVTNSSIVSAGAVRVVKVFGELVSDDIEAPTVISALSTVNPRSSAKSAGINQLTVKGDVRNARILIGYDTDGNGLNADASVGRVSVGGNWEASSIAAGILDTGLDGFGQNDSLIPDGVPDNILARITSIVIRGSATGSPEPGDHYGIVAQQIGSLKIAGNTFRLVKNSPVNPPDNFLLDQANLDFRLVEVV